MIPKLNGGLEGNPGVLWTRCVKIPRVRCGLSRNALCELQQLGLPFRAHSLEALYIVILEHERLLCSAANLHMLRMSFLGL